MCLAFKQVEAIYDRIGKGINVNYYSYQSILQGKKKVERKRTTETNLFLALFL